MLIENKDSKKYMLAGARFQLPMIFLWGTRGTYFSPTNISWSLKDLWQDFAAPGPIEAVGFTIMLICMIRIYWNKTGKLITTDLFALTRHPMYHGMYLADIAVFFKADLSNPLFWISWVMFTFLIIKAGQYQEKETLARWGDQAQTYYQNTPRFIFEWLWFQKKT